MKLVRRMTSADFLWSPLIMLAILGLVALLAFAITACGGDDEETNGNGTTSTGDGTIDYGSLSGKIRIDGSSTVFPISEAVAEEFS
jgi:phosphate transport system substrate-binding protein